MPAAAATNFNRAFNEEQLRRLDRSHSINRPNIEGKVIAHLSKQLKIFWVCKEIV